MKEFITKTGVVAFAIAIVALPAYAVAQSALEASIDAPADGATYEVGEEITFTGSATGGDNTSYNFGWDFDGEDSVGLQETTYSFSTTGTKTITLTVNDLDLNEDTDEITIEIVDDTLPPLEVFDIEVRAEDITEDSAIIRWKTNTPATSRVIYDTVSHADISGEDAPDFGYAYSTGTSNQDPMVTTHVVTVTGLASDTQYYFRVISTR